MTIEIIKDDPKMKTCPWCGGWGSICENCGPNCICIERDSIDCPKCDGEGELRLFKSEEG